MTEDTERPGRNDEDLIVRGTPALMLRRTYISEYRVSREFGIGTSHNGALFLEGDPKRFQWIQLVMPDGTRVRFERTSAGTSYYNAMYEHRSSPSDWQGARLGWTGIGWALKKRDGSLLMFQGCGGATPVCWMLWERDADGHRIDYRRDADGRLVRMETTDDRWIAFEYDRAHRITRAYASNGHAVVYAYDSAGRLTLHCRRELGQQRIRTADVHLRAEPRHEWCGIGAPHLPRSAWPGKHTWSDRRAARQRRVAQVGPRSHLVLLAP